MQLITHLCLSLHLSRNIQDAEAAKERNARRAKLERERYQKLTPQELEEKNRRRRERAALARQKKEAEKVRPSWVFYILLMCLLIAIDLTEHISLCSSFWVNAAGSHNRDCDSGRCCSPGCRGCGRHNAAAASAAGESLHGGGVIYFMLSP